jgi:cysteine desulfurase
MSFIYLDWAASTPPWSDLSTGFVSASEELFANTSSNHSFGKRANLALTSARSLLSEALLCKPNRLLITSGGTEADHIPLLASLRKKGSRSIVVSAIEHSAIDEQANILSTLGLDVYKVKPNSDGFIEPAALAEAVRKDTILVSVMTVNNETGAIQPLAEIARAVGETNGSGRKAFFHTDAVQALGKIPFYPELSGVDSAAFSAHKLGGPRGIGALYLARPIEVLAVGGGQENGIRPGTHNLAGAITFAEAAKRSINTMEQSLKLARILEAQLIEGIARISGAAILPITRKAGDNRYSPYIICAAFPGLGGETMMRLLDDAGIIVSTGSACSSGKQERRILHAMGIPNDLSFSSIRISTGRLSTITDIDIFLDKAESIYTRYKI